MREPTSEPTNASVATPSSTQPEPAAVLGARHAVLAGFFGWTLDAFDFFIVVFLFDTLSRQFGVSKAQIMLTTTATLAMRPVGAVLFGLLADRYGRRIPLMCNVIYFSVIELLCGFAPNFTVFLVLRALLWHRHGRRVGRGRVAGHGGGAAKMARRAVSGILQSGYSIGYLLAAMATWFVLPHWGWRAMFWMGAIPALLALYIRVEGAGIGGLEGTRGREHRRGIARCREELERRFAYLVVLMVFMMFLSHGTQDLYPDFLHEAHGVAQAVRANIAIIYNVGAMCGAIIFGRLLGAGGATEGMMAALGVSLIAIPLWAFGGCWRCLRLGRF